MLIGLIIGLVTPVRYTSITYLMPPKQTISANSFLSMTKGMGSLLDVAGGGLGLRDPNAIYLGLLRSRPIADAIIEKFDLVKVYHAKDMTAAREKLAESTLIKSETSTLISLSVTDRDKKRAAEIANAYPEQLRTLTKSVSATEASRRLFYEEQVKNQKEALVAAAVAFQQIQQNKGMVQLDAQAQALIGGLARLRAEIELKQVELQTLRSYSTEHNPEVQLAERELSALQDEAAKKEQYSDPKSYSDLGMKDISKSGLDYIRAQKELQYQQLLFDQLLTQYQAAKLDEAQEAVVIQSVEPAIEADRASSPRRVLILVLFTFGGFCLSCLLARWRTVVQSDPELAQALQNLKGTITARQAKVS
jgi:capsule polysaccharide export protein KpsE/RkpR